jgi:hypothetical protein
VCGGDIAVAALSIARSWVRRCSTANGGNSLAEKLFKWVIDIPCRNLYNFIWVNEASVGCMTLAVIFSFRC